MRQRISAVAAALAAALAVPGALEAAARGALPRYPTVSATTIVFTAAGDLWAVPRAGGTARQLTAQPGLERFARFSPDGRLIAYTGQAGGDDDVWVVAAEGGEPTRLTWHPDIAPGTARLGADDMVVGWTPDGREVVFRSRRESFVRMFSRLFAVGLDGSLPRPLPPIDAGLADFAPDGRRLAVTRPFLEARTWKRYAGGLQSDLWLVDLSGDEARRLTDHPGFDSAPMWGPDGSLYFLSDRPEREGSFSRRNLYRLDPATGAVRQLTRHLDFDVTWPTIGPGAIVYQHGGELRLFELASGADREVAVAVPGTEARLAPRAQPLADYVEEVTASPDGGAVLVVARGDLFVASAAGGPWRNLTGTQGVRERAAAWSPDGRLIACVSDAGGEDAIAVLPADGSAPPRRLTGAQAGRPEGLVWSPDSRALAWTDATRTLCFLALDGGEPVPVDRDARGAPRDPVFSPDGRLLAWAKPDANGLSEIWAWPVGAERRVRLSPPWADAAKPAFDRSGAYVFWVARTNLQPSPDTFEERWIFQNTDVIVGAPLRATTPSPLAVTEAEIAVAPTGAVDLDGVADRAVRLPIPPGRYPQLVGGDGVVFFRSVDPAQRDGTQPVVSYTLANRAIETVLPSTGTFALTADGRSLVWRDWERLGVCASRAGQSAAPLPLDGLAAEVDRRAEWRQELREVWRYLRDRFYDPAMHGVDWEAVWQRHAALLPQLADRDDLDFLIGEMIGELNVSHAYVEPPAPDGPERVPVGLLGCDLEVDRGRYRFARVFQGEPGNPERRAPLAAPGVVVRAGEYLLAVAGEELIPPANPFRPFAGATLRPVRLRVGPDPSGAGSREVTVEPVASDLALRTWEWVTGNRQRVAAATGGRVGYLHVPDTNPQGWAEFFRAWRAQADRDGLVVDLRYNAGGFIPDMFVELLARRTLNFWAPRQGPMTRRPELVAPPVQAYLINGYASSGGDALAYYARQLGLGPLIGTRTWGGLVGIESRLALVGGGTVTVPGWAFVSLAGQWDIERVGVGPDIEVDALPAAQPDAQLERAIAEVNRLLASNPPPPTPSRPPYPVRR